MARLTMFDSRLRQLFDTRLRRFFKGAYGPFWGSTPIKPANRVPP